MDILHPLWAEINIDNLKFNINNIKNRIGKSNLIGVVKCNAYGHGAVYVSKSLIECGVNRLAVANITEALELRDNEINANIMILGITLENAINTLIKNNIEPTISSYEFAYNLNKSAEKSGKIVNVHIALDTGMGRIGFIPNKESIAEIVKIFNMPNLNIVTMFSHFSTADEENKEYSMTQLERYTWFYNELLKNNISLAEKDISNSAAIIDLPQSHYENVRAGIIMYGYYPSNEVKRHTLEIKPILTLKTKITHLKTLNESEYLGYGRSYKTTKESIIATLPVGYGDGYSRKLSNKGKVIINGKVASIIGNVCMDQCMIDVTNLENIKVGDEVILVGSQGDVKFDYDDIAKITDTINYEPLTLLGRRLPRVYIENNEVIAIKHFM